MSSDLMISALLECLGHLLTSTVKFNRQKASECVTSHSMLIHSKLKLLSSCRHEFFANDQQCSTVLSCQNKTLVTWFLRPLHRCLHGGSWRYPQHKHPGVAGSDTSKAGILWHTACTLGFHIFQPPLNSFDGFLCHGSINLLESYICIKIISWDSGTVMCQYFVCSYVGFLGGSPRFSLAMVPQWQNCL